MDNAVSPVIWIGALRREPKSFPKAVHLPIGQALYVAQSGEEYPTAKSSIRLSQPSVLEIVADYNTDTWRAVYTVRFGDVIYVLHAFQKKSKKGIATPQKKSSLSGSVWRPRNSTTRKGKTDNGKKQHHENPAHQH